MSRRHATLLKRLDGTFALIDEGSLNGTFLDGERLSPGRPKELAPRLASLRIGERAKYAVMELGCFRDYLCAVSRARGTIRVARAA